MDDPTAARAGADESDEGFTLVETVVALMIATLMFLAPAMSLGSSLRASMTSRMNQQAIDLANDQLEQVRSLDFAAVAMVSADALETSDTCGPAGTTWCTTGSSLRYPNPTGGTALTEPLYSATGGAVSDHVKPCRTGSTFTCKIYITTPTDAAAVTYRRASVVVQWKDSTGSHTRFSSSYVTASRRGLPSPAYTWAATPNSPSTVTIAPGGRNALFATLTNQGIPLRWSLNTTIKVAGVTKTWTVQWYRDTNCSGSWEATETEALDSDGNGTGDTGIVPVDGRTCVVAVVYVPSSQAPASAAISLATAPVTATPSTDYTAADPVNATATITGTGLSFRTLSLHNWTDTNGLAAANSAAPAAGVYNKLTTVTPTAASLYNFDTDRNTAPGITIATGTPATWSYGLSGNSTLGGATANASVDVYAVSDDLNAFTSTKVRVQFKAETTTGVFVDWGAPTDVTVTGNTGFGHGVAAVALPQRTVNANQRVLLELSVPTGSTPVRLAYDTTGAPATLVLPYSSGNP